MKFLKENWFKLIIVLFLLIISVSVLYYFIVNPHNKEKKKNECISLVDENMRQSGKYFSLKEIDSYCSISSNYVLGMFEKIDSCNFELKNIKEDIGKEIIFYKGEIKNNSTKKQKLKSMIAKVYTEDMTYLNEGYKDYDKIMEPGATLPFEVRVLVPYEFKTETEEYDASQNMMIISKTTINKDIYPWFATCK